MSKQVTLTGLFILALTVGLALAAAFQVQAAPPSNDDFNTPYEILQLPFVYWMDISEATYAVDDPQPSCFPSEAGAHPESSVWFTFTPAEEIQIRASTYNSDYSTILSVYSGERGSLVEVACSLRRETSWNAQANTTYFIMVGALPFDGVYPAPPGSPWRSLVLDVSRVPTSPPNDDFDAAKVIPELPYTDALNTEKGTAAPDDPTDCTNNGSVWYAFTPESDLVIVADTFGSDYDTVLSVYTGVRGALEIVPGMCVDDSVGLQSRVVFQASAGTTYYFMIGRCCGLGGYGGGNLVFHVYEMRPPVNDKFSDAIEITAAPFSDTQDNTMADIEPGEPFPSCAQSDAPNRTFWYRITPDERMFVNVWYEGFYLGFLGIYTGTELDNLVEIGCAGLYTQVYLDLQAGQTYYFQLGSGGAESGILTFYLDSAPPLSDFSFSPADPSIYDLVTFTNVVDPFGLNCSWDFGDGHTALGCTAVHQYRADGEYQVTHTVSDPGGESFSTTKMVSVKTHDLMVIRLKTPKTARVRQTVSISVEVRNQFYPEFVWVRLYKSTPWGFEQVDELFALLPAQPGKRQTTLVFQYTFTEADERIGKVTFKASAEYVWVREALPCDNELISLLVKVGR